MREIATFMAVVRHHISEVVVGRGDAAHCRPSRGVGRERSCTVQVYGGIKYRQPMLGVSLDSCSASNEACPTCLHILPVSPSHGICPIFILETQPVHDASPLAQAASPT